MATYENIESKQPADFSSNSGEFNENVPSISCDDTSDDIVRETYPLVTNDEEEELLKNKKSSGVCCIMSVLIALTVFIIIFIVFLVLVFLFLLFNKYI